MARSHTKRRGQKARRNKSVRRGGGLMDWLTGKKNQYTNSSDYGQPGNAGYIPTTGVQPTSLQPGNAGYEMSAPVVNPMQQQQFVQGGKKRRNKKSVRRGGGLAETAAPISGVNMAQPMTMVGGRRRCRKHHRHSKHCSRRH